MSTPIIPFEPWESGTNQNSIPANNNILRAEIISGLVLGIANDESSPTEGDVWQVGGSPTGAFSTFDQFDLAIYKGGGWYAFAPVEGPVFNMDGTLQTWDGSAYTDVAGGGGASGRATVTAVTSASGVVTLNYALGDYFTLALSENVTSWVVINPPGASKGFSLMVQVTQDATPRTVAKPGTTAGGTGLDVSTGSGAVDVIAITSFDNGTTLRSTIAKAFS